MKPTLPTGLRKWQIRLLALLFLPLLSSIASAQCDNITLSTQQQVDAFAQSGCTTISGNLTISGPDITNLDGLSSLTSVGGSVYIEDNASLTSLAGLSGLSHTDINRDLQISRNAELTSLDGLNSLTSVGGNLRIDENASLTSLAALSKLIQAKGNLQISRNAQLARLDGLSSLPRVDYNLIIEDNASLTNLAALSGLTLIGIDLRISRNAELTSLDGLSNLTRVLNDIEIRDNDKLSSLDGLEKLTSAGGLDIFSNKKLSSITGVSSLTSLRSLSIYDSPVSSLAGLEKLTSLSSYLNLDDTNLSDLTGLSSLTSIGSVNIVRNSGLRSLNGLNKLTSIGRGLTIMSNGLTSISALSSLTSIRGDLEITSNDDLSQCSIEALCRYLTNPSGSIDISSNDTGCNSREEVEDRCSTLTVSPLSSGSIVCTGATVTVTVSTTGPARNYAWYRDNTLLASQTSATLTLPNTQTADAGTYRVVVSNSVTSLTSTAFNLTVNPTPILSISPSTTAICSGQSATFTAQGADSFQWQGPGGFASTASSITVSIAGSYSVSGTNSFGCSASATASLSVNPTPSVSLSASGPLTCNQTSVSLVATGAEPGATYRFSGGGLSGQPSSSSAVSVTASGTYSVTVTTTGGCSATATTEVTGSTAPPSVTLTNSGPLSFTNTSVTLTATEGAGYSYSFSQGAVQQGSSNKAQVTTAGVYSVTVTRQDNGCSTTASTAVLGGNNPTVCRGASATINVVVEGDPIRYEWYKNSLTSPKLMETPQLFRGTATSSLTLINAQSNTQGNFFLKVTDRSGSVRVYGPYRLTVDGSCRAREVAQLEIPLQVELAPNPIQQDRLRAIVRGAEGRSLQVELVDLSGKPIRQQHWSQADAQHLLDWDMQGQASGLYLLQIVSEGSAGLPAQRQSVKVVKP
ncbi:immunoglobulin domain-containing protein [Spirosoma knui]